MTLSPLRAATLAPIARLVLLVLLVVLMATLAGCSPGGSPLAKVGEKTITADDFNRAAEGNALQYPAEPNTAKKMLLEDLVRREMMLRAAHDRGLDTTRYAVAHRAELEERTLLKALYEQIGPRDIGVSDGEARAFWAWRATEAEASVIYAVDAMTARMAQAMLANGMPFTEVANRINMPGMVPPGGALGYVTPGSLLPPLDGALLTQPIGRVGGPYETPQGWFLLKVEQRRAHKQVSFEEQQSSLTELIRQRKNRQALTNGVRDLKQAYHVQVVAGAPQMLYRRFSDLLAGNAPPPLAQQKAAALATWDGGAYTFDQAIADMERSDRPKPQVNNVPSIASWLEGQATYHVALAEAKRRHLTEGGDLARRLRNEWEQYLLEAEYAGATVRVGAPTPAEVAAAYEQVKAQFPMLKQAHVLWLADADSAKAFAVVRHVGHGGGTLRDAVQMADSSLTVKEETIAFPTQDTLWAALQTRFARMSPTEFTGPEPSPIGWRIVQLLDKQQESMPYEQLPEQVKQSLSGRVYDLAREKAFNTYVDSLRSVLKPIPVPENLARLRWPGAGAVTRMPIGAGAP